MGAWLSEQHKIPDQSPQADDRSTPDSSDES
jgi:endogenous inhibitor of DNA gyrase (YacG/DUF329 family)